MAMLDEFGPSAADIRNMFELAAKGGDGYLLEICEALNDPMLVTLHHSLAPVKSEASILELLKQRTEATSYAEITLSGVFDLSKSYDSQKGMSGQDRIKTYLSSETQGGLLAMKKAIDVQRAYRDWVDLPWYRRLLTPKPF